MFEFGFIGVPRLKHNMQDVRYVTIINVMRGIINVFITNIINQSVW